MDHLDIIKAVKDLYDSDADVRLDLIQCCLCDNTAADESIRYVVNPETGICNRICKECLDNDAVSFINVLVETNN